MDPLRLCDIRLPFLSPPIDLGTVIAIVPDPSLSQPPWPQLAAGMFSSSRYPSPSSSPGNGLATPSSGTFRYPISCSLFYSSLTPSSSSASSTPRFPRPFPRPPLLPAPRPRLLPPSARLVPPPQSPISGPAQSQIAHHIPRAPQRRESFQRTQVLSQGLPRLLLSAPPPPPHQPRHPRSPPLAQSPSVVPGPERSLFVSARPSTTSTMQPAAC